jgi:hypothetical protein
METEDLSQCDNPDKIESREENAKENDSQTKQIAETNLETPVVNPVTPKFRKQSILRVL